MANEIVMTREELHAKVWAMPLPEVAEELGVAVKRLRRACSQFDVPRPGQGHWRVGPERRPPITPLPSVPARGGTIRFDLEPAGGRPKHLGIATEPPAPGDGLDHPLITKARQALARARVDPHGWLLPEGPVLAISVTRDTSERALLVMARVLRHVDANGWAVEIVRGWEHGTFNTNFKIGGHNVRVSLLEKGRLDRHVATDADRKRLRLGSWQTHAEEHHPTGILCFRIHPIEGMGSRHSWVDNRMEPLEARTSDIAAGLAHARTLLDRKLEEQRQQEARWAIERKAEFEWRMRIHEEKQRRDRLQQMVDLHTKALQIRSLVADAVAAHGDDGTVAEWASWARGVANELDPVTGADAVAVLTRKTPTWIGPGR